MHVFKCDLMLSENGRETERESKEVGEGDRRERERE